MKQAGFTLIETLVALSIFVIVLVFSSGIMTGLMGSNQTRQNLDVLQAATQWFENATHVWSRGSAFGDTTRLPAIPTVQNASWSAQLCEVNPAVTPTTTVCGSAVTTGIPLFSGGATTTTGRVVQLNLTYTPTGKAAVPATLELARR